ncbi:MAG: Era-like GTP-binding protein, partial [Treponema sp.]|nr:Era-like GTP-binding protein [Treponema sp.]
MGLNETPSSGRVHIAFFGRRNVGKSSLVNAVTGQELALVSDVKGTTTDPVYKAMELLPIGPVVIIDTPGIDDEGELGEMRVLRAKRVLNKTDAAVLVAEAGSAFGPVEEELVGIFRKKNIPFIVALNKSDTAPPGSADVTMLEAMAVSAKTGFNVDALKDRMATLAGNGGQTGK